MTVPLAAPVFRSAGVSRVPGALLTASLVVSALSLIPFGFVLWVVADTGLPMLRTLLLRPRIADLLLNTALLLGLTLPLTAAISVALAWLTERSDLKGAGFWSALAAAPLAIPAFVHAYAWIGQFPTMQGVAAAVLISTAAYFPFVYLPVAATLRRLDPALEDVAASLGHTNARIFLRVVVPQLRLPICAGSLLVGLHLLAEYGLYATVRYDTFTTAIFDQFQSAYAGPAANAMASVLILCCLLLLWLDAIARGRERYARVGAGAARSPRRMALGRAAPAAFAFVAVVAVLGVGVPAATLGRWLVKGGLAVWTTDDIARAVAGTAWLAFLGGAVTTLAAIPMAWLSVRANGRLARAMEACQYYTGALPGVVVALALVAVTIRVVPPLYQTTATLILAYLTLFLSRALTGLRASLAQVPVDLEWTAASLGRSPLRAIGEVTLRVAAPGMAAAFALVSLGISNELTATLLLAPNGVITLATEFWALSGELDYAAAAPYAALMVALSVPMTALLHVQSKRIAGR